jgi:hypothetical protein
MMGANPSLDQGKTQVFAGATNSKAGERSRAISLWMPLPGNALSFH